MFLRVVHWIGVILVWFSAILIPQKYLPWAILIQLGTMMSWLMFHRCILWDLEIRMDPTFKVKSDTTSSKTSLNPETVKKSTDFLIYTNLMLLGYRMNVPELTSLFITLYVIINKKFEHRGNDDLDKY